MNNGYYSLHNHTDASNARLIDSINKPTDLIKRAFDLGLSGIAITDHETIKAHVKASQFIKKKRTETEGEEKEKWDNFKVIFGNEIYLCRNGLNSENYDSKKDKFYHFILLAVDEIGHEQIRRISTKAYGHSFMKNRMLRVPTYYKDLEEVIGEDRGHLIASSACIGGFLGTKILKASAQERYKDYFNEEIEHLKAWIEYIQSIFGKENFFLELQPSDNEEQLYVNKWLINFSKELNIPAIVTCDSHFLKKEDREIHKAYLNSKEGDREVDSFYATAYLMGEEEIHSYMDKYNGAETVQTLLDNTKIIGSRITNYYLEKNFKLPYLPSEEDKILANNKNFNRIEEHNPEIWNNFINSEEAADRVFIHRILNKCHSKPEEFLTDESINQIEIELDTVWKASKKQNIIWSKYFLQVADYIKIAWDEGDTIVGCGRGSGVGFYLNYLLDLTQINPLKEEVKTYFWRYLNPERVSILDCDTDIQSNRRNKVIEALQKHYGEQRVIRVMTERTEASKSAILTAARGLGIDNDIAQYIASLIESDRGKQRSLKDTYYGNEEEGFLPNKTFQEEMNKYPQLWEVAQRIEGLACGCGSHAGGVIIVDEDITKTNSLIKINSGEWTTAWDLHESESAAGNVKIDLLATLNLTRIRTCLDLLVEHGYIEKGKTLRETYEKAIGIYNLERTAKEMWDMVAENKIVSLFQFETDVGRQGTTLAAPKSVADLCALNSIIRLMATEKGGELPVEKFSRFKENHLLWEQEMNNFNLSEGEKEIIRKHLTTSHGICECQESLMSLIQEPEIAGWNLKQADYLRKSIAKKDKKLYEQLTKEFYDNALEKKLSPTITRYFWEVLVKTQAGYSFCAAHCLAYSLIGLQNINLAYKYPIIFWNTANLIVDSSGVDEGEEEEDEESNENLEVEEAELEEEVVDIFEEEDYENYDYIDAPDKKTKVKRARKATNYGKVASAIGKFMSRGINILPPDINNSSYTFSPNVETNSIVYGLRGITRVSNDIVKNIIANRPYSSLSDFLEKNHTNKLQTLNLIKSGSFDMIENKSREEIMNSYLDSISDKKNRLTLQNMQMLINYNLIPEEMDFYRRLFLFNKFLKANKNGLYYVLNESAIGFISNNFDFDLIDNGNQISQKVWDTTYKKSMEPMKNYLKENNSIILEKLNSALFNEVKEKYAVGGVSKWEMDSISFYYHDHELKNIKFPIVNFFDLPEEPQIDYSFFTKGGQEIKVFKLSFIAGTVIDKNKLKNSVTLLTKDGVVNVKIYKNQYSIFDKQISERGEDGKKHVIEAGWFKKGTLLLVQGIRRGQDFVPKKTKSSIYPVISKITDVSPEGDIKLQLERVEVDGE